MNDLVFGNGIDAVTLWDEKLEECTYTPRWVCTV